MHANLVQFGANLVQIWCAKADYVFNLTAQCPPGLWDGPSRGLPCVCRKQALKSLQQSNPEGFRSHPYQHHPCHAGGRLHQAPAPELAGLRQGEASHAPRIEVDPGRATPIERVCGPSLEVRAAPPTLSSYAGGFHRTPHA